MRIPHFALIVSFLFLALLILNYVVFYIIGSLFSLPRTWIYYTLLFIAALSFPISSLLEREFSNFLTRALYTISATWIGISFYIIFLTILYVIISLFIEMPTKIAGIVIVLLALIISGYAVLNATFLKIKEINIAINGLKRDIKAAQLSDVHIGPIRNLNFIRKMVDKTNALKPDIIFITGDLFDGTSMLHEGILNALNRLEAPSLFVTGNHDTYQGLNDVFDSLKATKVKTLRNQVFNFGDLQILGVDYSLEDRYLENTLQMMEYDENRPTVLMYHLPRELEAAAQAGVDLQLSGHTHDGQMFPFTYLVKIMFPYIGGLYNHMETHLYVSSGTGTWGPPMRLGSRCEITSINLIKK
jgi:predicted MPP superfamily phosphohydrolase